MLTASTDMIDPAEQLFIDRLRDPSVSVNDKSSCLDVLEVLLPDRDMLPALAALINDAAEPQCLKEQAERLARSIDPAFAAKPDI
jgi:hypothetical protein